MNLIANKNGITLLILLVFFFAFFLPPRDLHGEFYEYVDKNGKRHFVDSMDRIPFEYRDRVVVYQEKYDNLPEEEKAKMIEKDRLGKRRGSTGNGKRHRKNGSRNWRGRRSSAN